MNVVISQPMFFPWIGLFEQIRLADVYVHYSDVQFSKGSFVNRVQIKTSLGPKWLTVPLEGLALGQRINEVRVNYRLDWRSQHLELLRQAYASAVYRQEMLDLVESVYASDYETIDALSEATLAAVCRYFQLNSSRRFIHVEQLGIEGTSSQRVLDIVLALGGDRYITGLGARNYLDHERFEAAGVRVEYMNYHKTPYPQLHGEFTPYVSILDLIANVGRGGISHIHSNTVYWKDFLKNG